MDLLKKSDLIHNENQDGRKIQFNHNFAFTPLHHRGLCGTIVRSSVIFCSLYFLSSFFRIRVRGGIVSGLGLGTGLALGLRVGWV